MCRAWRGRDARIPSDGLRDAPSASTDGLARFLSDKLRSRSRASIGRTHIQNPLARFSHGRISPALGRPMPIQPFPNPDMDGIDRHSTTTQPSFVSNPKTIPTQPSSIRDPPTPTQPQPQQNGERGGFTAPVSAPARKQLLRGASTQFRGHSSIGHFANSFHAA